jgi:hypothetical protein
MNRMTESILESVCKYNNKWEMYLHVFKMLLAQMVDERRAE